MSEFPPGRRYRRTRFLALLFIPTWVISFMLDQTLTTHISHIELWWTLIVSVGSFYAIRNLLTARADRAELAASGRNGEALLAVSFNREFELVRFVQEAGLWLIGVFAMTWPPGPPARAPLAYAVTGFLFTVATGLTYNSWLAYTFRQDLDALIAKHRIEQHLHDNHVARSDLEDQQEKEE